jgi:hypothetical protein
MFQYICIILREFQSCTLLKLRGVYIIKISLKNYQIKIFMWLLVINCSLYDFYNIICISSMFTWQYIHLYIPVLLPVCWGGEYSDVKLWNSLRMIKMY